MAGKTKRDGHSGSTPRTPKTGDPTKPLGHLGVKSSPFAPTDCKLVNQYMVRDRMTAHYKKLNKARPAVDTAPPKAWLVSQKMRDQARREAIKADEKKDKYPIKGRPHSARRFSESDVDRDEMMAMMQSDLYDEGLLPSGRQGRLEVQPSNLDARSYAHQTASEMQLVNSIVEDNTQSPSRYSTHKTYKSNIPSHSAAANNRTASQRRVKGQQPLYKTQVLPSYSPIPQEGATVLIYGNPVLTPRSADLIDRHKEKFTEEKNFQPRTLKTNRESKLSQFKYYNPPKRKPREADHSPPRPESAMSTKGNLRSSMRPGTANTMESSADWMNDTLMSRDYNDHSSPSGVPRLDISLDKDNLEWLKDQSGRHRSKHSGREEMMETGGTFTLNGYQTNTSNLGSKTAREIESEDEEIQYLEFVKDVTNDILDRGIFTNRVLKQVFETHVIRKRHQLKEERMREMLEDLRIDLGIPAADADPEDTGLTATWSQSRQNRRSHHQQHEDSLQNARSPGRGKTLPNLHARTQAAPPPRGRTPSPDGKPPLPKGVSKNGSSSRGYLDSTTSSLGVSQDYSTSISKDGDSVFGTVTQSATVSSGTDLLTRDDSRDTLNGGDDTLQSDRVNGNTLTQQDSTLLYQQQLQASLDHDSDGGSEMLTDRPPYTQRSEESQYTERASQGEEAGYTERTPQSSYRSQESAYSAYSLRETQRSSGAEGQTERTGGGHYTDRTVEDDYTSVTEEDEAHYTERTLTNTARSNRGMDDSEVTPRRKRSPKSPKSPKYAHSEAEPVETARSEDFVNVTQSDTIEVSDIEDY